MLWLRLVCLALTLSVLAFPARAESLTLSGTVTYLERISLPADAQLRVTLVRLPQGSAVAGASAAIPAKGGPPISFSLNLHNGLATTGRFGLLAEIRSEGRILFRNRQPVPVTSETADAITISVQFAPEALPQAPQVAPPVVPEMLVDVVWTVTSIGGRPASGERALTLSIAADQRVGGSAGCNNYFAEATMQDEKLTFGPAVATRMACGPQIMEQEADYLAALAAVGGYELDGTSLRLLDAAGIPLIGLVRDAE